MDSKFQDEIEDITNIDVERKTRSTNSNYTIENDITGQSNTNAEYSDFLKVFRDRYSKIKKILTSKMGSVTSIRSLEHKKGETVKVVGMVKEIRQSHNPDTNNKIIVLQDTTGSKRVVVSDEELLEETDKTVKDEVIGIKGNLSDDGNVIFSDEVYYPDVKRLRSPNKSKQEIKAALISDTHFGSKLFSKEKWKRFVRWLCKEEEIEYLIIAGDLVEGIGIYPDQEEELAFKDIKQQYRFCAKALEEFPDDLKIICTMGNHDSVRLAEPQTALKEELKSLFPENVDIRGNPVNIKIEGVNIVPYHGVSINSFADSIPGKDIRQPEEIMQLMIEKRHLAPMFGRGVRLSPEEKDYLVLEEVPDILVSGHVHKIGSKIYKDVKIINPGCWVGQTNFQEKMNIDPDVGYCSVVNLKTGETVMKSF
jgi:DNA polymerase II small subunit